MRRSVQCDLDTERSFSKIMSALFLPTLMRTPLLWCEADARDAWRAGVVSDETPGELVAIISTLSNMLALTAA